MRELKYRGWNGERMLNVVRIHLDADGAIWWSNDFKQLKIYNAEHGPLMQYIGLKDRNRKEVYEGDIYRQKGMDSELIIGVIKFYDDHSFRCVEAEHIIHWVKFAGQVIGNIYENPELAPLH